VPYDNHAAVHYVTFENGGSYEEIALPTFGNDASAIDFESDLLYVASWAQGEIDVVDLAARRLRKRITGLGIIPHMFTMAFNPNNKLIYYPKGATAVNGAFGAAVTVLDPKSEITRKVVTGWAPIDLIEVEHRHSFFVFNSEDQFAEVWADGRYEIHDLPFDYPVDAARSPKGNVYLSYGPHQSYWPTVYIWGAKNGVLMIDKDDLGFYDRRIPRQAHKLVLDKNGVLYFPQNNWGSEPQFIGRLEDEVRLYDSGKRLVLPDTVTREITQRILKYDADLHRLYLVRVGEKDDDPSILQVYNIDSTRVDARIPLGVTAADLLFDGKNIYVANFSSNSISVVDKSTFSVREIETGSGPLKLCRRGETVYALNHLDNTLQEIKEKGKKYKIPSKALPDNVFVWKDRIIVTSHDSKALYVTSFDPAKRSFKLLHKLEYPYGDTRFDSANVSFYVNGQFGDAVFSITRGEVSKDGDLWLTDFLSGKLLILKNN
jgi:YVTN family beta-propeller protein